MAEKMEQMKELRKGLKKEIQTVLWKELS